MMIQGLVRIIESVTYSWKYVILAQQTSRLVRWRLKVVMYKGHQRYQLLNFKKKRKK